MGGINSQKTTGRVQISVLKAPADTSANQREGSETCFSQEHTNDLQWSFPCCIYSSIVWYLVFDVNSGLF